MDANVVVSPLNVKFTEQLHALEVLNTLGEIGEWGDIFLGDCIEWAVIDDVALFIAIFC